MVESESKREVFPYLLAIKKYEKEDETLVFNTEIYEVEEKKRVGEVPDLNDPKLKSTFDSHFTFSDERNPGFVVISAEHQSPYVAKMFVDWMVEDLNLDIAYIKFKELIDNVSQRKTIIEKLQTMKILDASKLMLKKIFE